MNLFMTKEILAEEKNNVKGFFVCTKKMATLQYYLIFRKKDCMQVRIVNRYLKHKTETKKSVNTVKKAAFALGYYLTYLQERGLKIKEIASYKYLEQETFFIKYLEWLKNGNHKKGNNSRRTSNKTCNEYLNQVFEFYKYLVLNEEIELLKVLDFRSISVVGQYGVTHQVRKVRFEGYLPGEESKSEIISNEDFDKALALASNKRDYLILMILRETGFRIGQLLGIKLEDIEWDKNVIHGVSRRENENGALSKREKSYLGVLSKDTMEKLESYYEENKKTIDKSGFLFVNLYRGKKGSPMNVSAVRSFMKNLSKKSDVEIRAHKIRHLWATEMYKEGWHLEEIQYALGHSSIETTRTYVHLDDEIFIERMRSHHKENIDYLL